MKWSEIVRLAEANGWRLERHGKRHDIYWKPETGERLLIERRWSQEVKRKLLNKLQKQIGF